MKPTATDPDLASEFLKPIGGPGSRRLRLALVENDWQTHCVLRKIFTTLGWEVESAMTVAGGIALLDGNLDALILDPSLPDGDGLDVLRWVRLRRLKARVVVVTEGDDPARVAAIRQFRPDALVRKPVELDAVIRALGTDRTG